MCKAINHPVLRLRRSAMGKIKIGDCEIGKYRYLTEDEIKYLKIFKIIKEEVYVKS